MKRLVKITIVIAGVVAGIAGLFVFIGLKLAAVNAESKGYAEAAIADIGRNWDYKDLVTYASERFLQVTPPQKISEIFDEVKKYGPLIKTRESKCHSQVSSSTVSGSLTVARCTVLAACQNGVITIEINISKQQDGWKIDGFHVNLAPLESAPSRSI